MVVVFSLANIITQFVARPWVGWAFVLIMWDAFVLLWSLMFVVGSVVGSCHSRHQESRDGTGTPRTSRVVITIGGWRYSNDFGGGGNSDHAGGATVQGGGLAFALVDGVLASGMLILTFIVLLCWPRYYYIYLSEPMTLLHIFCM